VKLPQFSGERLSWEKGDALAQPDVPDGDQGVAAVVEDACGHWG
jgi:hypothetical protein